MRRFAPMLTLCRAVWKLWVYRTMERRGQHGGNEEVGFRTSDGASSPTGVQGTDSISPAPERQAERTRGVQVRLLAWQDRTTAIFGVTWAERTGRAVAVNVTLEADPERLAQAPSLPEHLRRDIVAEARRVASEFSKIGA